MLSTPLKLRWLPQATPLDNVVRIEMSEGLPIFRAVPAIQNRIEELLDKQHGQSLSHDEQRELSEYEELDDFLSLVNRVVRNSAQFGSGEQPNGGTA